MPDRLTLAFSTLTRVFITPSSNLKVAYLLYATIAILLLLILVAGVLIIGTGGEGPRGQTAKPIRTRRKPAEPRFSARTRVIVGVSGAIVLAGLWLLTGHTTSDPELCKSCHWPSAEHARAEPSSDPHASVRCVSCHERGGRLSAYTINVPLRIVHLIETTGGENGVSEYGHVTARACTSCHESSMSGTLASSRGIKISHAEPLASAARCVDCHRLTNGIVALHNAGMEPCLRCHDGQRAAAACDTCHDGEPAAAARPRTAATAMRGVQIPEVSCSGCHTEEEECDPCHGTRLPHSAEFKASAHSRAAAIDIWDTGGTGCRRCHTSERRPCSRCHTKLMGAAHGTWMAVGHRDASAAACNTCHLESAPIATRDFCKDVCHSAAAVAASDR